ncbi:MAG TPA: TonB-dependent receptor [Chitinophagaceae bacterium]|nr:TonB-dependent receptor [Chitinophagaceae bacterium]
MRKLLYAFLLICVSQTAFSQLSSLKGSTRDTLEKKNLSNAVITLLRPSDSVLVKYVRTDTKGDFTMGRLDGGEYIMLVSYPKFADYSDKITIPAGQQLDIGTIPLTPKNLLLQEVIIRANNTIKIKGDTTEFNADSFKVREGATVEELLKVIPGMQVNSKGEITAQGKRVDKVLVDGEEFFGADPTIATQNIGAKAVDKVQVYDTKTEQDQLKGIGAAGDGNKTINIKLKESAKKGYFGKAEASSNFDKLHNGKLMFNNFKGSQKISVYGTKSNVNTGSLGWEERNKMGVEEDMEYDEIGGYYYSYGDGDNEFNDWNLRGIPNAHTVGALYGNKWNEDKHKLNLSYLYNRLGTKNTTTTLSQTLLKDTTLTNNSTSRSEGLTQQHSANGKYEWKLDSLTSFKYTVAGSYKLKDTYTDSYSESFRDSVLLNNNSRFNQTNSTKKQLDNTLMYKQLFKKKNRQLMATLRLGLIEDESTALLTSTTKFYKNNLLDSTDLTDQQKINTGNSTTYGTKITYNEPLSNEWNLVAEYSFNKNVSNSHRNSYDKDVDGKYTDYNPLFSNNFDLDATSNSGTLTARYMGKKLRLVLGTGLSAIRLNMKNLDQNTRTRYNFTGFTPTAQFGYKLTNQSGLSISYRGNTVQPTLSQLQPLPNNSNPLDIYIGNPDLKVGFNHSIGLSFNDYKVLSGKYTFANLGVTFNNNAITNFSDVDLESGKRTYYPINVNGNYNYYFWSVWNSGQGDKKLSHEIQPSANGGRSVNFINGERNVNTYSTLTLGYGIRYSAQDKYNFYVGPNISRNLSKSSLRPTANNNYWSYGGRVNGWLKLPWNLEIDSDADFNLRQKTPTFNDNVSIIVWNAQLTKKFLKDKSLRLSAIAHDILNKNIGFNRTINSTFINEERYDRLARYFLLQLSWTFNKMPGSK